MTQSEASSIIPGDRLRGEDGSRITVAAVYEFEHVSEDRLQPAWLFLQAPAGPWHRASRCRCIESEVLV